MKSKAPSKYKFELRQNYIKFAWARSLSELYNEVEGKLM